VEVAVVSIPYSSMAQIFVQAAENSPQRHFFYSR